jgi:pyrroloquinoline-quinone synthase
VGSIDRIISEWHLLKHPFYQRWQAGQVQKSVLRSYAAQYYSYESALPTFLEAALSHLDGGPAREAIEENLRDEAGGLEPHPELWLRFAEGLGLGREEVLESQPLPRTRNLVETYAALCDRGADEALGAIYAYEAQFSQVAAAKADGLRRFYDVTDERALAFFDLHATIDDWHASALRSALHESEPAVESVHLAVEAWWGMLDQFEALAASTPK